MRLFFKFLGLTLCSLFFIGLSAFLLQGSWNDFQEKILVFTSFLFTTTAFVCFYGYFYFFANNRIYVRIVGSILLFSVLFVAGNVLFSLYYYDQIPWSVFFFQTILGISILLLEILISTFFSKYKDRLRLQFFDPRIFYFNVIVIFSLSQGLLFSLFFIDVVLYTSWEWSYSYNLIYIFMSFLVLNCINLLSLFVFFKKLSVNYNNLLKLTFSVVISCIVLLLFGLNFFRISVGSVVLLFLIVLFSQLFLFFYIKQRDNAQKNRILFKELSTNLSKKEAEYMQLKNQINPHFLFNNLNTLITFIELNPSKAIAFAHNLANVYRHYLKNQSEDFVPVFEELSFISDYLAIYKAKFQSGFTINIEVKNSNYYILSSCLQEVVDNVFKHNVLEDSYPIEITISIENENVVVKNSINPCRTAVSNQIGLKNINKRYLLLLNKGIKIHSDNSYFTVTLPILHLDLP